MANTKIRAQLQINNGSTLAGESGWFLRSDGSVPLAGDLDLNNHRIQNLAAPVDSTDAATKGYVDGLVQGLDLKASVRAGTTNNIDLTGGSFGGSVDGIVLSDGDRVLVKNQTLASENGIYTYNLGSNTFTRANDANTNLEVTTGLFTFIEEGLTLGGRGFTLTSAGPIVLGVTNLTFTQFSTAGSFQAGQGLTLTGNILSVVAGDSSLEVNANDLRVQLDPAATLELGTGLKVANAVGGQILIGQGLGTNTSYQTISGDATLANDGTLTLTKTFVEASQHIYNEVATRSSATVYTLANAPVSGSQQVFVNGLLQNPGVSNDYTIAANTLTFTYALDANDTVMAHYLRS